jgi:hypothetical protein
MLTVLVAALSSVFKTRAALQLENLSLRHQLSILHRSVKKPKLTPIDRLFWAWLCRAWPDFDDGALGIYVLVKRQYLNRLTPSCRAARKTAGFLMRIHY